MYRLGNQGLKVVVASSMISSKNTVFNFCFPKEAVYYSAPDSTDLESKCHLTILGYPHHWEKKGNGSQHCLKGLTLTGSYQEQLRC